MWFNCNKKQGIVTNMTRKHLSLMKMFMGSVTEGFVKMVSMY